MTYVNVYTLHVCARKHVVQYMCTFACTVCIRVYVHLHVFTYTQSETSLIGIALLMRS